MEGQWTLGRYVLDQARLRPQWLARIEPSELDVCDTLDKFVSWLIGNESAFKTVLNCAGIFKRLLDSEGVVIDEKRFRRKIVLPAIIGVSIDRVSTHEGMSRLPLKHGSENAATHFATRSLRFEDRGSGVIAAC